MTPTSVGMRCPECAKQKTQVRRGASGGAFGARPFSLNDPSSWTVTHILIAINVVVFFAQLATGLGLLGGGLNSSSVTTHGYLLGNERFSYEGQRYIEYFMSHGTHEYYRLLTSAFLHANILHIGMNMLFLWFVGRSLEPAIGKLYLAAIYFTAVFAGSFGAILLTPDTPTLGASGAIFGVFGALIVVAHSRRIPLWQSGLMPTLLINLIFTLSVAGVSAGGHAGGLVSGLITGWFVVEFGERRGQRGVVIAACVVLSVAAVLGAIALSGSTGLAPGGTQI